MQSSSPKTKAQALVWNSALSAVLQVILLGLSFIVRKSFVSYLGNTVLSQDALYSNIYSLISIVELGLGSAIIYTLYSPINKGDSIKISEVMRFAKKSYFVVFYAINIIGVLVLVFYKAISQTSHMLFSNGGATNYVLYVLANSSLFLFGHHKLLLIAREKNHVNMIVLTSVRIVQGMLQYIMLKWVSSYTVFLLILLLSNLAINAFTMKLCKVPKSTTKLKRVEIEQVFARIRDISIYRIGAAVLTGTDYILITIIQNISLAGISSNYMMIVNATSTVINQVMTGVMGTIGSFNIRASKKDNEKLFEQLNMLSSWVFGVLSIMLAVVTGPFVGVWLGSQYQLDQTTIIAISLAFYVASMNSIPSTFRSTMGLFRYSRFTPIVAAAVKVTLSVILGKWLGVSGVFFATAIAKLSTFCVMDPLCVYKYGFGTQMYTRYYLKLLGSIISLAFVYTLTAYLVNQVGFSESIQGVLIMAFFVFLVSNLLYFMIYGRTKDIKGLVGRVFVKP